MHFTLITITNTLCTCAMLHIALWLSLLGFPLVDENLHDSVYSLSLLFGSLRYASEIALICATVNAAGFGESRSPSIHLFLVHDPSGSARFDTCTQISATSLVNLT